MDRLGVLRKFTEMSTRKLSIQQISIKILQSHQRTCELGKVYLDLAFSFSPTKIHIINFELHNLQLVQ